MKHELIMENWRKYKLKEATEQPNKMPSIQQVDDLLSKVDAGKALSTQEIQLMRTWLTSPEAKNPPDDNTKNTVIDVFKFIRDQQQDQTFKSDAFTLKDIEASEPELAKAIKVFRSHRNNIKQSNLLFDGSKLHWRIGRRVIYSWSASSGHYEDDLLARDDKEGEAAKKISRAILRAAITTYTDDGALGGKTDKIEKILSIMGVDLSKESEEYTREGLSEAINDLLDKVDEIKPIADEYRKLRDVERRASDGGDAAAAREATSKEFQKKLTDMKKQYFPKMRSIRKTVTRLTEITIGAGNLGYQTSADDRRKKMNVKDMGPIPEGKYLLKHTMQDLTNMTNAPPYAALLASVASLHASNPNKQLTTNTILNQIIVKDGRANQGDSSWGRFRVRISNIADKDRTRNWENLKPYKGLRGGFFIHGGSFRGSSGCIDLGDNMDSFAKFWTVGGAAKAMGDNVKKSFIYDKNDEYWQSGGWISGRIIIPLFVKYTDPEKRKLVAKNPVATKFAKAIFQKLPAGIKKILKPTDQPVATTPPR